MNKLKKGKQDYNVKLLVILSILFELIIYFITPYISDCYKLVISIIFAAFLIVFVFLFRKNRNPFYIIFVAGLLIRTIYILSTSLYTRQHDVGELSLEGNGHYSYIYILYSTHHLPTIMDWQFYHPPLWHLIGSLWLFVNSITKFNIWEIFEGMQTITVLFSLFSVIVTDKICVKLKLKNRYRYLIDSIISFHPTLLIFSGHLNNDCLLLFMEFLVVLLLINFYQETTWKNTIYLALATGLCVMTKMNGAVMAVPIMYVFIIKLIKLYKEKKEEIKQFLLKVFTFGLISLPIGLWYPIRNIIKFSTTKIPEPGYWLYTGDKSLLSRFIIPNFKELMNYADMDNDYNIIAFIIKSSIFGEFQYENVPIVAKIMLILNIILILLTLLFMIQYLKQKKKNIIINMLIITWLVSMILIYIFYYKYPFACSMDFRYITICLLSGVVVMVYQLAKVKNKYIKLIIEGFCYLFVICSVIFFFTV